MSQNFVKWKYFFRSSDLTGFWKCCYYRHTAHETAICRNPSINSFTGDKSSLILNIISPKHVTFLRKCKDIQYFYGHNILTEGVFLTEHSSNAGISVWRIVWDTTNCCFRSGTVPPPPIQFSIYINHILSHSQCRQQLPPKQIDKFSPHTVWEPTLFV